jgi:hypothetical protein
LKIEVARDNLYMLAKLLWICIMDKSIFITVLSIIHVFRNMGYFRQFFSVQLDSQPSRQTVKLRTAAFSAQQLSLHSSFPYTASHRQPKQTGPWKFHHRK